MKNSLCLLLPILFLAFSCEGQDKKTKNVQTAKTYGTNPKEEVKVNRTYDKNGHLVKFDSTFSYTYSSKGRDSSKVKLDTVLQRFKTFYNDEFVERWNKEFKNTFLTDSLFKYDFPNDDYFSKRLELNMERMRDMMTQMDSLKTSFIKESKTLPNKKPIKK